MINVNNLTCGTCYRCCTTNEEKRFRTPILESDIKDFEVHGMNPIMVVKSKILQGEDPNFVGKDLIELPLELVANQETDQGPIYSKVIPDYQPAHTDAKAHGCNECKWLATDTGLCSQYEKRPFICKQYPFQLVNIAGNLMKSVVTNNCGLGKTIYEEICKGNQEIIDYANKVFKDTEDNMTIEEMTSMGMYASENYKGFSILNI